ncbi:serine--glyoxylate aminotransferase-like [Populus alba x Populus x berolinensis]|uniref:Serine--glyoxylate aminotransferase-like n=1 Tax=Populus alba x Populus x berolinensis TaxID=444605 RepID=A0AAD6WKI6_9ROSI|nr:serine--glyoxylate aminotransferase-like [Populus alba x Populus x berolinensis]
MSRGKMDYFYGPGRNHLFVPGPVNIPESVLRAMNRNNEDYRSPAVPAMTKNSFLRITPFIIPTTGTGAWESALTNTLSPGDRTVSFLIGQFSLLWIDQQKRLGFNVDVVESDWGQGANLDILASKLAEDTAHIPLRLFALFTMRQQLELPTTWLKLEKYLMNYRHPALFLVDEGVLHLCS